MILNSNNYQQIETLRQKESSDEKLIQFYVFQDLQNLINLIYSRQAVLNYFKNNQNHPMVILSNNKIILQLKLSCGIHKDLNQQYQGNQKLYNTLKNERSYALEILEKVIQNFRLSIERQVINNSYTNYSLEQQLEQFRTNYKQNNFRLTEFQLQNTNQVTQFDQSVLQKVISSIQTVDFQVNDIRENNNYQKPNQSQIISRAEEYQRMIQEKLSKIPQNTVEINSIQSQGKIQLIDRNQSQTIFSNQSLEKNPDIKQHFYQFFTYLGYFNEKDLQYNFFKELENFIRQAKQQNFPLSSQQKEFKIKLEQKGIFDQNLKLYYYFEQFFDFYQLSKQLNIDNPVEIFRLLIVNNQKHQKTLNQSFYQYLIFLQSLIEKQIQDQNASAIISSKTSTLSKQIIFNQEYVYQMFSGYYQYIIQRK